MSTQVVHVQRLTTDAAQENPTPTSTSPGLASGNADGCLGCPSIPQVLQRLAIRLLMLHRHRLL
jgi:hypothetical protein